jgi:hypothetical protein
MENRLCLTGLFSATDWTDWLFDVSMTVSASLREGFPIDTSHFGETGRKKCLHNALKSRDRDRPDIAGTRRSFQSIAIKMLGRKFP